MKLTTQRRFQFCSLPVKTTFFVVVTCKQQLYYQISGNSIANQQVTYCSLSDLHLETPLEPCSLAYLLLLFDAYLPFELRAVLNAGWSLKFWTFSSSSQRERIVSPFKSFYELSMPVAQTEAGRERERKKYIMWLQYFFEYEKMRLLIASLIIKFVNRR